MAQNGKGKKVRFQGGTVVPITILRVAVVGIALIAYSRTSTQALAVPPQASNSDHWHIAFGIFVCDDWLPNITGNKVLHFMTGNLSFQVEHHLFPDLPSNRYAEIAPQVQALFAKYDLPHVTGSLPRQVASAWHKVFRLSLPNGPATEAPTDVRDISRPAARRPAKSAAA